MRFYRDYELFIAVTGAIIEVRPPLRISFNVTKSLQGLGLNKATVKIYGLQKDKRQRLLKDEIDQTVVKCELRVGYQGGVEKLFTGDLRRGESVLGSEGFETTLEFLDGWTDYKYSFTSKTVTTKQAALDAIIEDMPNSTKGKITNPQNLIRPKVLVGNSAKLIEEQLGQDETFYIDEDRINIIKGDEVITSYIPVINSESGLLNTPQKQSNKITFETLMNPYIKLGGRVELQSAVEPSLNGIYKVESIIYSGDTEGSDWKQAITCFANTVYKVI